MAKFMTDLKPPSPILNSRTQYQLKSWTLLNPETSLEWLVWLQMIPYRSKMPWSDLPFFTAFSQNLTETRAQGIQIRCHPLSHASAHPRTFQIILDICGTSLRKVNGGRGKFAGLQFERFSVSRYVGVGNLIPTRKAVERIRLRLTGSCGVRWITKQGKTN